MKSPMVETLECITDKDHYSELQVLSSAAGYYIGTLYWNAEYRIHEPGSRDSEYFKTSEEAERRLEFLKKLDNPNQYVRMQP